MAGLGIYGELLGAQLENLASDANFVVAGANPTGIAPPGLIYFSSATKLPRWHTGTAWVSGVDDVTAQDISNKTFISGTTFLKNATGTNRKIGFDLGAATDSTTATLTFIQSANAAYTFPSASGTLSTLAGTESLLNKTISSTSALTGALTLPVGTTTNRDGLTTTGMVRFNSTDSSFEGYDGGAWSSIGGAGVKDRVTQTGHGFSLGNILYLSGGTYAKAKADAANTAEVVGMVSRVVDANTFEITLSGEVVGLSGLTAGEMYFLSAATAGAITITEPSVIGQVSLPVGVANSTTSMYVQPKRGILIGATNVRTNISLSNNSTSTVQNVSSYDAGKLSGWVSISATTPLRFYVEASFSKSGAGSDYFLSYRTSGDNPPVGFSLAITSSGIIQCAMPSVIGFVSASINYGLDVAAVGTALPLSVNPSAIVATDTATEYSGNTKLGLMQYVAGTNYNGSISPTVTGTNWSTVRAVFVPYQMADSAWRVKFNVQGNFSVATAASSLSVTGLTVKSTVNQAIAVFHSDGVDTWVKGQASGSANTLSVYAGATKTAYCFSGDIELNSKPTWAY